MKKKGPSFHLYPENDAASRLSVAGGGVKLLSTLVLVAAILYSAGRAVGDPPGDHVLGMGGALHHLLDDAEEGLFGLFVLWGLFAACRYAASVLQAKAKDAGPVRQGGGGDPPCRGRAHGHMGQRDETLR